MSVGEDSENGYLERISALVGFRRLEEAATEARRGIAEWPDSAPLWAALAHAAYRGDDVVTARDAAERTLTFDPHHAVAMLVRSAVHVNDGDVAAGVALGTRLVSEQPEWGTAHIHLAYLLSFGGPLERAMSRQEVARALELEPEEPDHYRVGAGVFHRIGDSPRALELVEQGLRHDPTSEGLHLMRAQLALADDVEAVSILSGILAENPQQSEAAGTLDFLVWRRLTLLTGIVLWIGPVFALVRAFFSPLAPAGHGMAALVASSLIVGISAAVLLGRLRARLPQGYLSRYLARWPRARLGVLLSVGAPLGFAVPAAVPELALVGAVVVAGAGATGRILVVRDWYLAVKKRGGFTEPVTRGVAEAVVNERISRLAAAAFFVAAAIPFSTFGGSPPERVLWLVIAALFGSALLSAHLAGVVLAHLQVRRTSAETSGSRVFVGLTALLAIAPLTLGVVFGAVLVDPPPRAPTNVEPIVTPFEPPVFPSPDFEIPEIVIPEMSDPPEVGVPGG